MYELETTKQKVTLIAPELIKLINGVTQKTRCYIQSPNEFVIQINDKTYMYEVQEDDTIEDIIEGLITDINEDEDAIVAVVDSGSSYFDIRGLYTDAFTVTGVTTETLIEAVDTELWDLYAEDIANLVNEDSFKSEIERGQRYLMAHMLTLYTMKLGGQRATNSEKVGDISVQYADPTSEEGLGLTGYGVIYKGIYLKNRRLQFTRSC